MASRVVGASRPIALGSLDVDDKLKLGCLLNRHVRRLLTLEDAIDILSGSPVGFGGINTVGHEAAAGDVIAIGIDRRQPSTSGEYNDPFAKAPRDSTRQDEQASAS